MKALMSVAAGGAETLQLIETAMPEPGAGEIRVRIIACSINYPDALILEDKYQLKPERPFAPGGEVVGVDAQPSMLDEARARAHPNQRFVLRPLQRLDGAGLPGASFDVVTSRATLHWVPVADWPGVLASARRLLRPGGWLRVECGGIGNVQGAQRLLDELSAARGGGTAPWAFLDPGTAMDLLEGAGFDAAGEGCFVRCVAQRRAFDATTLAGWLTSQVSLAYGHGPDFDADVLARLEDLRRWDGTFDQTWVRLDVLARG